MKAVIEQEFFARVDPAATEEKNMTPDDACMEIGVAAVIDAFGPGTVNGAVNAPDAVQTKQIDPFRTASPEGLLEPGVGLP